jgi:hypothetical protein
MIPSDMAVGKKTDNSSRSKTSTAFSTAFLVIFALLLVASLPSFSPPGYRWSQYVFPSLFAFVPLALGPRRLRLMAAIGLFIVALLMVSDYVDGRHWQEKIERTIREYQKDQGTK